MVLWLHRWCSSDEWLGFNEQFLMVFLVFDI